MSQGSPHRHHFIPAFYTKRWAAAVDGKVCEYSRPYGSKIVLRRKKPEATGFEDGLYSLRDYPSDLADQVEEDFFRFADQKASDALNRLEGPNGLEGEWPGPLRSAWSRFILSLLLRHPTDIAGLRAHWSATFSKVDSNAEKEYAKDRRAGHPATFQEYLLSMPAAQVDRYLYEAYVPMIDNVRVGSVLNRMIWNIAHTGSAKHELLTSDRPVIRTNLMDPMGHLVLPIGPRRLFVAAQSMRGLRELMKIPVNSLVEEANRQVVAHAIRFVWARTNSQARFIANRFGSDPLPVLLEPQNR